VAGAPLPPPAWATIFQEQSPSRFGPVKIDVVPSGMFGLTNGPIIWFSADGRGWTPLTFADAGITEVDRILSVVEGEAMFVAVGERRDERTVWVSEDGAGWRPPAKAPPCCISAVFPRNSGGFRALGKDPADGGWFLAISEDGSTWSVNPELPQLDANAIWASAHIGAVDMVWTTRSTSTDAWTSGDGVTWLPIEDLGVTDWTGVWRTADSVLAGVRTVDGPAILETNGVSWNRLDLSSLELGGATIDGAATVGDGFAVLINDLGRQQLYQVLEGSVIQDISLSGGRGFGGLRAVLVSGADQLRIVGLAHGRMSAWEWVPAE
jgi:hypothetical protein